jgi:signal transduction histidine kinase/CheY-like chemotaxis protein
LDVYLANSTTFLLFLRASGSSWSGLTIGILLLLLAGAVALLLRRENAATATRSTVDDDVPEHQLIKQELEKKSAILSTVNHALNTFLDSGDWSAASRHLLSFALEETHSEFGLLGAVLEGPVLRVLAHNGIHCGQPGDHHLYESKMKRYEECGYFELEHRQNLLGEVIQKAKTVVSINPSGSHHSEHVPPGHPLFRSFLGVPIFKGSEIVGLIGVANRPGGYTGEEVRSLETISQTVGVLYDNYRQSLTRQRLEEERTRLESEFRQAQKMEVLGQLAGGVAHDFNNMLMVLTSSAELLERTLPPKSKGRPYLEQFQRTTERAAAITRQLLAFSRKQVLDAKPVDLHEVLTESEFMLPRLLGSDVQLTFAHHAARSWLLADPSQLEQIIANLAINARDAMPCGGSLTFSTSNVAQLPPSISASVRGGTPSQDWLVLEVADTGSGMDEVTRNHVFEPFFTTKPVGKGTGLGLSTVYGIVRQFAGQIQLDSQLGAGTRFRIFFPVAEPSAARPASAPAPQQQQEQPHIVPAPHESTALTVLLVDDEVALRSAVAEYLRSAGHQVLESQSALDALELARHRSGPLDILLTDVVMPELRGPELALQVQELHPNIHVIYMSGYAEGGMDQQIPPEAAFLQKPFRFATLAEQLKLLPRRA